MYIYLLTRLSTFLSCIEDRQTTNSLPIVNKELEARELPTLISLGDTQTNTSQL